MFIQGQADWRWGLLALALSLATACHRPATGVPEAETGEALRSAGAGIAAAQCAACHAIAADDTGAHSQAPPLRYLSRTYPVDQLAEALAEGIVVGHPDMPVFAFSTGEIEALLAYLDSIQEPR